MGEDGRVVEVGGIEVRGCGASWWCEDGVVGDSRQQGLECLMDGEVGFGWGCMYSQRVGVAGREREVVVGDVQALREVVLRRCRGARDGAFGDQGKK